MTRLGYQIPNFTYPGIEGADIFRNVVAQAQAAEAAGFDRVFVMDHFYQLPGIGAPDEPMFECYTMLSALAQHTETVRLSALVTGNTYRHPTLLAKAVTALDHVSGGRATLGIGAGWFELEHNSINELLTKFLSFLISKRRFFYVDKILKSFVETCSVKRGELKAELTSAKDLTENEINNIKEELTKNFSSKIKLNYKHDASLIGGLIVQVGSTMVDTSIKNKLQQIENRMIEA